MCFGIPMLSICALWTLWTFYVLVWICLFHIFISGYVTYICLCSRNVYLRSHLFFFFFYRLFLCRLSSIAFSSDRVSCSNHFFEVFYSPNSMADRFPLNLLAFTPFFPQFLIFSRIIPSFSFTLPFFHLHFLSLPCFSLAVAFFLSSFISLFFLPFLCSFVNFFFFFFFAVQTLSVV